MPGKNRRGSEGVGAGNGRGRGMCQVPEENGFSAQGTGRGQGTCRRRASGPGQSQRQSGRAGRGGGKVATGEETSVFGSSSGGKKAEYSPTADQRDANEQALDEIMAKIREIEDRSLNSKK